MTDLEALRRLPRCLVEAGYLDAVGLRGILSLDPSVARDVELCPPATAALVELFFLRRDVAGERVVSALPAEVIAALLRLGVLVARGGALSTMELVALPVLGQIVLVPSPGVRTAFFGDEVAVLITRMRPVRGSVLIIGAGPGALCARATESAARIVAVEPDPIAHACAELNVAMNGVTGVELRREPFDAFSATGERFDSIVVAAPTLPVPVESAPSQLDGPAVLGGILGRLPDLLAEGGLAQLVGVWHGGAAGPSPPIDLARLAAMHSLRVVTIVASRHPLGPGSPLFEAIAGRIAAARPLDLRAVRAAHAHYLEKRGVTHLFLVAMTVSRAPEGSTHVSRHWTNPGGAWQR